MHTSIAGLVVLGVATAACVSHPAPRDGTAQDPSASGPATSSHTEVSAKHYAKHDKRYAKPYWHELPGDESVAGEAWTIPHCEADEATGGVEFAPKRAAAPAYNDRARPRVTRSELEQGALTRVAAAASARRHAAPQSDPRLDVAARELAELVPKTGVLPVPLVEFAIRRVGVVEPAPLALVMWGPLFDTRAMLAQLDGELPAALAGRSFNRVGVGAVERPDIGLGAGVMIVLFQSSFVTTDPVPRSLPARGVAALRGKLSAPYDNPRIELTTDKGDRTRPRVLQVSGRAFRADVPCGHAGRQHVTIKGTRGDAIVELAKFPIWCGDPPPDAITLTLASERPSAARRDPDAAARHLAAAINRERARCGLGPIRVDATLSRAATSHSREMSRSRRLTHHSDASGSATDRARGASSLNSAVHEFVARSFRLDEVERQLLTNVGYRAAILSVATTHMGVGVTVGDGSDAEFFITQLFVSVPSALSPGAVRDVVARKLAAKRDLIPDSDLAVSAQAGASALSTGTLTEAMIDRATRELRRVQSKFARVKIHVWTGADVTDFRLGALSADRNVTHFGLGVVRGHANRSKDARFYIVLIIGELAQGNTQG